MQMKRSFACAELFQRAVHAVYRKEAGDGWGRLTKHEDHEAKKNMKPVAAVAQSMLCSKKRLLIDLSGENIALENWSPPISHVLFKAMHGCAWWSFQSLNSQECCSAFVLKGGIHDWAKFCEAFDFEDPGFSGLELLGAMCSARWANGMLQLGCYGGCRNAEILAGSVVIGKAPL